jgi:hypothetical protein
LKRIDPDDLGIAIDAQGNQTVVVTSVEGKNEIGFNDFIEQTSEVLKNRSNKTLQELHMNTLV